MYAIHGIPGKGERILLSKAQYKGKGQEEIRRKINPKRHRGEEEIIHQRVLQGGMGQGHPKDCPKLQKGEQGAGKINRDKEF